MKAPSEVRRPASFSQIPLDKTFWQSLRCPGITTHAGEIELLARQIPERLAVLRYKQSMGLPWVILIGGTGTGKSTLFNAICGKTLSETGVERPKTSGPVAFVHRDAALGDGLPFPPMVIEGIPVESVGPPGQAGTPGAMVGIRHEDASMGHFILVDTPDVDSVEPRNRQAVEALYLLADVVIFVASQEKYADDVPFRFLMRVIREGKLCFAVLNKGDSMTVAAEVLSSLGAHGLELDPEKFWVFPHIPVHPSSGLAKTSVFEGFRASLFHALAPTETGRLMAAEAMRFSRQLESGIRRLHELLVLEDEAARGWLEHLEVFFEAACQNLLEQQQKHFTEGSREVLQKEIRKHFSKYDLLRTPRRMVSEIVLTPFQLLGLVGDKAPESHQDELLRVLQRIDLVPVKAAMEGFNRAVLEKLSPRDPSSPLYGELRSPAVVLTDEEVRAIVREEQDRLIGWLEGTFEELARGIPRSKEWGIYSTSILWGGLILSLEAAIGGGITILEAVLDTAVAPFVTKGAVELFAYHELQKIARELGKRYQDGLVSSLRMQKERYVQCLTSLSLPQDTLLRLKKLEKDASANAGGHDK